jgi:hypothetical protein
MKLTILIIALQVLSILGVGLLALIAIETDREIEAIKTKIKDIDNFIERTNYRL